MNGATEVTIAALLQHSTTGLVTRYAHLSPSHLKAAVEGVASFGKESIEKSRATAEAQKAPTVRNGTVTRTGIEEEGEMEKRAEVVGKIGAPRHELNVRGAV